jgi:hypothetical protein
LAAIGAVYHLLVIPFAPNQILQAKESTNLANIETYFLFGFTSTLTSRQCQAPVRMSVSNKRLAVVITTPKIEAEHATPLLPAFTPE